MVDRSLRPLVRRPDDEERLRAALASAPVVLLTGPRQAGKSTLALAVTGARRENVFDLEDPAGMDRLGLASQSLRHLGGTVVLDEAHRRRDLFPVLRTLVDRDPRPGRFLVIGSASPQVVAMAVESLEGRLALVELSGLRLGDVGSAAMEDLWLRGGLPPSFLAEGDERSAAWRDEHIERFLEWDLANLGFRIPPATMRRFWTMVAHHHGQPWNGAELARATGTSESTVRRYLEALIDTLVVRQLRPWRADVAKRQVRSPKVYVRDTGILHRLLGVSSAYELLGHPKVGASFEGFVIEQLLQLDVGTPGYWATHAGSEIDLLVTVGGERVGVEIKRTDLPGMTPSMRHAIVDLGLDRVVVVHSGEGSFPLSERVVAVAASTVLTNGVAALVGQP